MKHQSKRRRMTSQAADLRCHNGSWGGRLSLAVLDHSQYLKSIIVFATSGFAGRFLMPMVLALF